MTIKLKGRRVALIGGAGFIGHNLALALAKAGAEVVVIDGFQVNNLLSFVSSDLETTNRDLYINVILQRIDLLRRAGISLCCKDARDYHALYKALSRYKPQVVVHLAAVAHAGRANKDPYSTFDHSLRTLENALDYSKDQVEQFIYLSSSMVYGNFNKGEVKEDHPLNPIGIYGALKLSGEKLVIAYQQVYNLPYTIVRPSAIYGPRCVSRRVSQVFIENALEDRILIVNGDGQERLDFTYIDDLIQGVMLIINNNISYNNIFNITYGQSRSINDLINIIKNDFPSVAIEYVERDKLMPYRGTLSIKKAMKMLEYKPEYSLEVGLLKYINWYKSIDPSGKFLIDIAIGE